MHLAQTERAALCDLLELTGPDAPTLCEGWTTHDLAAHLWVRETDPLGAPGIIAKPLASLTERRMEEAKQRWSYPELVARIRRGPAPLSLFALPGLDEGANALEFFVHHEDVRRAGQAPLAPRDLPAETEDWMWRRLQLLARAFFRRTEVGVVLERSGAGSEDDERPATIRAAGGSQTVTLVGRPSELILYGQGRGTHADVLAVGEPEALQSLGRADLGL